MILMLQICFVFGQKKVVVIDVGHGGKDTGAIGVNTILEKEVVLNVAKEIIRLNKILFDNKHNIYLTRYTDTLISLSDRSRLAKALKADVFVSLHCNASQTVSKGMEVYVHNSDRNIKVSIFLGVSIFNESTRKLGFKKRGVKFANFQVLRETINFCTTVLVEMGFVTNSDEASYLLKPSNIKALALSILIGINNYLNTEL
ncbi:MAG: N-acetylmuramoyl-L-alanine amidase [Flavobacteriaceae bacterium]|nr:N-acetylmuramoyl-L-alanine amidase [Flavobacteriaceae bacterium]